MILDCSQTLKNIGVSACKKFPQAFETFIKVPLDFTMTAEDAALSASWQTEVLKAVSDRAYLFPIAYDFENLTEEAVRATSNLGKEILVRLGQYRFRSLFRENLEAHKAMYSHLGSGGGIFPIDINKKLIYTSDDGGETLKPFTLDQFAPEGIQFGDGQTPSLSPIYWSLANNDELNVNGFQMQFTTQLIALKALTDVKLSVVGTPSATAFTVAVKSALDNVGITGLVTADFIKAAGISAAVFGDDNGDGTYDFTGSGLTTGTITLRAANLLTVKAYEAANVLTVTIA
jgi:hypothetical protein